MYRGDVPEGLHTPNMMHRVVCLRLPSWTLGFRVVSDVMYRRCTGRHWGPALLSNTQLAREFSFPRHKAVELPPKRSPPCFHAKKDVPEMYRARKNIDPKFSIILTCKPDTPSTCKLGPKRSAIEKHGKALQKRSLLQDNNITMMYQGCTGV